MTRFLKRLHINIFTLLLMVTAVGAVFRFANIVTFKSASAPAVMAAQAVDKQPAATESVQKSVDETVKALNEGRTEEAPEGRDSIQPPAGAKAESGKTAGGDPADTSNETRSFSASEIEVLQSLSKRRESLDKREQQLGAREALLKAAEQEVDKKVGELNTLKADIEKLLGQQQTMEDSRIVSLVKIYEGMKPKEAATIFNTLDMDVLLAVISRMSERKSSPVLAAMDPNKARIVTIKLAEQRRLPSAPEKKPEAAAPALQAPPGGTDAETIPPATTP